MRRFDGTSLVLCNERTAAVSLGKNEVAFRISASRHHASKRKHHDSRQCQTFLERKRKEAGFVLKWQDAFETICPFDL
jgi:hypothetical protein